MPSTKSATLHQRLPTHSSTLHHRLVVIGMHMGCKGDAVPFPISVPTNRTHASSSVKTPDVSASSATLTEFQGGLIILSRIENEYGPQVKFLGAPADKYIEWVANMTVAFVQCAAVRAVHLGRKSSSGELWKRLRKGRCDR